MPGCVRAGFEDVEVWTHPEPTPPGRRARSSRPISRRCACAPTWPGMAPDERARFLREVAAAMPEPVIDYVRLNISARRRS